MGDFFHGWRRKAGCVTLVMAYVSLNGWLWDIEMPERNMMVEALHESIAVNLTFISAYLILWKPRKRETRPPQS